MANDWHWVASFSASCLHAAHMILCGKQLVNAPLTDAITSPALALGQEIQAAGLPEARLWRHLHALGHQIENNRELALTAMRRTVGVRETNETAAAQIAGRIGGLETAMQSAVPQMVQELTMRSKPLREFWEAYGSGLVKNIGQQTDERLVVERAEIVLVYPVTGGGGSANLLNNSVRIEAVLTNNVPKLPEVVRLAWLIAQLNNDLPLFGEKVQAERLPLVASLAMIPPCIQAAQEFELTSGDDLLPLAIAAWINEPTTEGVAETVSVWWHTYLETRPTWATALEALDQMLGP